MNASGPRSLGRKVTQGAGLLILLRVVDRLIGLASFAVLARLLVPGDFGLFALAISVLAIIELFGHAGIDVALIQRHKAGRAEYDTAWTLGILIGTGTALVVLGVAAGASVLGDDQRIGPILCWLALASFIGGFDNPGVVDFQKQLQFGKEFRFNFLTRVIRTAITIFCAVAWQEVWALVAGYVAGKAVRVALSFLMHLYRPRLSLASVKDFIRFSGWLLVRNIATGLGDHVTNLIIGLHTSATALGFFTAGRNIANLATSEIQAPIRRALFPSIVALKEDKTLLRQHYLNAMGVVVLVALPVPAGVALMAHDIVFVLLGDHWLPAVPLIQILALAGVVKGILSGAQTLLIALGKPRKAAELALLRFLILLPLVVVGTMLSGVEGAAWGVVAAATAMLGVNMRYALGALELSYRDLGALVARPLAATVVMTALVAWAVSFLLPAASLNVGVLGNLIIALLLGGTVYAAVLFGTWVLARRPAGGEKFVLDFLTAQIARLMPAS